MLNFDRFMRNDFCLLKDLEGQVMVLSSMLILKDILHCFDLLSRPTKISRAAYNCTAFQKSFDVLYEVACTKGFLTSSRNLERQWQEVTVA